MIDIQKGSMIAKRMCKSFELELGEKKIELHLLFNSNLNKNLYVYKYCITKLLNSQVTLVKRKKEIWNFNISNSISSYASLI